MPGPFRRLDGFCGRRPRKSRTPVDPRMQSGRRARSKEFCFVVETQRLSMPRPFLREPGPVLLSADERRLLGRGGGAGAEV